jgi:hypothetical protein
VKKEVVRLVAAVARVLFDQNRGDERGGSGRNSEIMAKRARGQCDTTREQHGRAPKFGVTKKSLMCFRKRSRKGKDGGEKGMREGEESNHFHFLFDRACKNGGLGISVEGWQWGC